MYCDKQSMLEMVDYANEKQKWQHLLLSVELFGAKRNELKTKQVIGMIREWQERIRHLLKEEDAAHLINGGNVFALIHNASYDAFKDQIHNLTIESEELRSGVRVSVTPLTYQEAKFLLYC